MTDNETSDSSRHWTHVDVGGGKNTVHGGSGHQYIKFGGPWVQIILASAGIGGVVTGILRTPPSSPAQQVCYGILLSLCIILAVVCLWFACKKRRAAFIGLVASSVLAAATAASLYKLLHDHGSISAELENNQRATGHSFTLTFKGEAARSRLRFGVDLRDINSMDLCHVNSKVSLTVLHDAVISSEKIEVRSGQIVELNLNGPKSHVEIEAVINTSKAGPNCKMKLGVKSAVFRDEEWWLP
ncbi:hypothetical protein ACGFR8_17850 [Streptomyces brevispora]|uniref:hypothetical protein n=1 Tax=Streptomyces brevispora TaxID=887462 RepID=UPI0037160EF6